MNNLIIKSDWSKSLILLIVIFQSNFNACSSTTAEDDLSLTLSQKKALDKFKESVADKIPQEHFKQDVYLIRWLRARKFNVQEAEQFLLKNLEWRKEKKMDTILEEDWSDMAADYPYTLDTRDKEGKPVMIGEFGNWDLRNAEITGRLDRLIHYGERIMEEEETLIRKLQEEGKFVTRAIVVLDMDGVNIAQHMCSRCLNFLLSFYNSFEDHYPNMLDRLIILNNHPIVNTVFYSLLASFAPETRKKVHLYDRNKSTYSKALLEQIPYDQLPEAYGGGKKSRR